MFAAKGWFKYCVSKKMARKVSKKIFPIDAERFYDDDEVLNPFFFDDETFERTLKLLHAVVIFFLMT